jgi:hypothetical protein
MQVFQHANPIFTSEQNYVENTKPNHWLELMLKYISTQKMFIVLIQ